MYRFALTSFLVFYTSLIATGQISLAGKWNTGKDNTVVERYEQNGKWYAKIISSNNPDAVIGKNILLDFTKSNDVWKGKLYAPKRQKTMEAVITPKKDVLSIVVTSGWVSRTIEWTRVKT
jgi:uncharacterized protein (DUF2147 family)